MILTITLPERLDSATVQHTEQYIHAQCETTQHESLVLDATQTNYISSSGLRVILGLAKTEKAFKVINVCTEVYDIFEMTGFTRIFKIERKMRNVSIDGCPLIGKGGVGSVYKLTDDTIIKVFREGTPLEMIQQEIDLSKEALVFGLPTAISFETVMVGNQYALIHELLNAQTLSNKINEDTSKAEYYGAMLGRLMKDNHRIKDSRHVLPDAKSVTHEKLEQVRCYFCDEHVDLLREIYDAIPAGNSILHCDFHPKNVMISNGELMLIDMGEICSGNPLQDLGHTYSALKGLVGDYESIVGLKEEIAHRTFNSLLQAYFDTDDQVFLARKERQIQVASLVRNFSWLSLSNSFPQQLIDTVKREFILRVLDNISFIREVLPEFQEWEENMEQ